MQRFRVDLKTFSGLAMPNQCCHAVTKLISGWFVGGKKPQTVMIRTYSTTILYDNIIQALQFKGLTEVCKTLGPVCSLLKRI